MLVEPLRDFLRGRRLIGVIEIGKLEPALFFTRLLFQAGQFPQHAADARTVPVVIDVIRPVRVFGQVGSVVNPRAETADQHIGNRNAVLLEDSQRGFVSAAGNDAQGDFLAITAEQPGKRLQRLVIAQQSLVDIGKYGAVTVGRRLALLPFGRFAARTVQKSAQALGVGRRVRMPGVMLTHALQAVTHGCFPLFAIAQ